MRRHELCCRHLAVKPVVWQPRSSAVDLAYVLETDLGLARSVVPDGRCGVALVDAVPWWFGPHTDPWTPSRPGVHVVGVRLSLTAGHRAAGGSLRRWQNTRAPLSTVWWTPAAATRLATRAARSRDDAERVELLIAATLARVDAARPPDEVAAALAELVLTDTPVFEIARHVGLSTRQVHRRCLDEFGLAPSLLRRIGRVHRAARHNGSPRRPSLAQLAADAGFADQSHFCREIRALSGETPRAAFGWARPIHARPGPDRFLRRGP